MSDLSSVFETVDSPIGVVLMPSVMSARIIATRQAERLEGVADGGGAIQATRVVDPTSALSYVAACPTGWLTELLKEAERVDCLLQSITTADYAWAEAARMSAEAVESVVAAQLEDAPEIRIIAVRSGQPTFWRRLPLRTDLPEIEAALRSAGDQLGDKSTDLPILVLGDAEFRGRIADAAKTTHLTTPVETPRLEELDYDPAAVAAAFAGTGPRFVPPDVVRAAKARTRWRALLAAAVAVICIGLAGFFDILDLRSEIDRVRVARQDVATEVQSAMAARDDIADHTTTLAGLESRRQATPRWTAILGEVASATPRDAHVRALRAVDDSIYVELEAQDVLAAVESLRQIPWWRSLRTASSVATQVEDEGTITERVTVAGVVDWGPLNQPEGQAP